MSAEQQAGLQPAPLAEPGHLTTQLAKAVPDSGGRRRPGRPAYVAPSLLHMLRDPTGVTETGLSAAQSHSDRGPADDDPAREPATLMRSEDPEPLDIDASDTGLAAPTGILNGVFLAVPIWIFIGLLVTYLRP